MARTTITVMTDDIDGSEAARTMSFGFDGVAYVIDLSEDNARKFKEVMSLYLNAGTRMGRMSAFSSGAPTRRPTTTHPTRTKTERHDDNREIREWAKRSGFPVHSRGRIPQSVVDAYHAAGDGRGPSTNKALLDVIRGHQAAVTNPSEAPPALFSDEDDEVETPAPAPKKTTVKAAPAKVTPAKKAASKATPVRRPRVKAG